MKFKVTGDNLLEISRLLDRFCKEAEKEYEEQIKSAKKKLKDMPFVAHSDHSLPDVLALAHVKQDDHIILMS